MIFSLGGFSRNLRKEITKNRKYYFYDLGIRNILIDNLKPLSERIDQGALWENFLIAERIKRNHYLGISARPYFWRVYTGSEIDYVEDGTDGLHAFELKYRKAKVRPPKTWVQEYPEASWKAVNMQDWTSFVL